MSTLEQRLQDLEVRYTHQQSWIDDLNQVVRDQGDLIALLRQEIKQLKEQFKEGISDERPPHY